MRAPRPTMTLRQGLLLALLAGLAVLGNVSALPLFFGIQILLGSIVPTLILLWRRGWWSVAIAVVASLYTWKLWGHPWAIVIFSAEALWQAVFVNRFNGPPENDLKGRIILAEISFWLLVGTPMVFFFYGVVLQIDPANVAVTAAKQAVNGLANTVMAFLLFVLLQVWRNRRGQGLLPLRGLVFSVVLAAFTLPSLALTFLSGNLLQGAAQEAVLDNLQTVAEAAARIDPRQLAEPTRGLPASPGATAFLLIDREGHRTSSNPGLFLRLENNFLPAPQELIQPDGLQILVPRGQRPALKVWIQGYWSTTVISGRHRVQVVQPARPVVLKLQAQSTTLLTASLGLMLLGVLLSELMASLVEGQMRLLRASVPEVSDDVPDLTGGPEPDGGSGDGSVIAEVQGLVGRLHEHLRREARLSQDLAAMSERFRQSSEQLRRLSSTDLLTGARNRSELERSLQLLTQRASDCAVPLSCLAFAVQGLRPINTVLGRQKGDEVLQRLIASVKQLLHANDELFRIGGSEFLLLLWDQPLESARTTAEQIRRVVTETAMPAGKGPATGLAMNAGVSLLAASDASGQAMLSRVELALNQSRDLGANQVVVR
ncbi:GGDEF domain-containing protein [Synechococcus sp. FACHB-909]|uniref:sensor domain-containing diguanylate cyclase n=1 Tax=Synechococcus sp. FACHB-909 TaxID=2692863 RepID=UPI001688BE96|nr:GGDEF domain-containing protein [Synechococcus sp. FACHB-909]MBD2719837.1 GGDEF domain-containing protein [Synechococcus sp. FACHB-909]